MTLIKNWFFRKLFNDFQWYRKKIGGKWYNVMMAGSEGGLEGPHREWTQEIDNNHEWVILEEEDWPM